jgi:hypothetical protein
VSEHHVLDHPTWRLRKEFESHHAGIFYSEH